MPLPNRPLTNLKKDPSLQLDSKTLSSGFMALYRCLPKDPLFFYAGLAMKQAYPTLVQSSSIGSTVRKSNAVFLKEAVAEAWVSVAMATLVSVKKNANTVSFSIPVCVIRNLAQSEPNKYLRTMANIVADGRAEAMEGIKDVEPSLEELNLASLSGTGLWAKHANNLKGILNGKIVRRDMREFNVWFLEGQIPANLASFMTQVPFAQMRPMDIWALLYSLVQGRFGAYERPPLCSIPLSKIAETLPHTEETRLGIYDMVLDENNVLYVLPTKLDNVSSYESEFSTKMLNADGTFSMYSTDPGAETTVKGLPSPRPLFLDWVNHKFTYVLGSGRTSVKDLIRCVPANISHVRDFLQRPIMVDQEGFQLLFNIGGSLGVAPEASKYNWVKTITDMAVKAGPAVGVPVRDASTVSWVDVISIYEKSNAMQTIFKQHLGMGLFDYFEKLRNFLLENAEVAYAKISVLTYYAADAKLACLLSNRTYESVQKTIDEDRALRSKAINQGKDPNFKLPALPYIAENRALVPHQVNVQNTLRESPDFALLPIAAGGGKTMVCVTEYLKLLQEGKIHRALIMCPSHLVSQYVTEFVYATKGKINVIPFVATTFFPPPRGTGLDQLTKLVNSAPINTVVVADYNLAKGPSRSQSIGYGTASSELFPIVDILRSFRFDCVWLDEAHYLKSESTTQRAVASLVSDIKMKRLMTGTLTPNVIQDIVRQMQLFDPGIFGSSSDFIQRYAEDTRGSRITKYRAGALAEINSRIRDYVVVAGAKRKEWAAFLPPLKEVSYAVSFTSAQRKVYTDILSNAVEELIKQVENNPELRERLYDEQGNIREEAMQSLLGPTFARLEIFTIAPMQDELGRELLHGDDLKSPKIAKIIELLREHREENGGKNGKVIIFCNNLKSVDAIYDALPNDLRDQTIKYSADTKTENVAEFNTNPRKQFMVGVQQSMNTGLNLQVADFIIRTDTVWTPGEVEQGNSRIQRPNLKVKEQRQAVKVAWLVASGTIDVLKSAFLLAKMAQVRKLEESGNPLYDEFEPLPLFPIKMDTILEIAQLGDEVMQSYFDNYASMKRIEHQDYANFKKEHPEYLNAEGLPNFHAIPVAPALPGSKLMYKLPYVPGMDIFNATELGLVRYDQYLIQQGFDSAYLQKELESDGDEEEEDDTPSTRELTKAEISKVEGLWVHTEFGDGEIIGGSRLRIRIRLTSGEVVRPRKMASFIITRKSARHDELRTKVLKEVGEIPFDAPEPPASSARETTKAPTKLIRKGGKVVNLKESVKEIEPEEDTSMHVELHLTVANDFPGLIFYGADENKAAARALEAIGFTKPKPFYYAPIPTYQQWLKQLVGWEEKGFKFDKNCYLALKQFVTNFKSMRKNATSLVGISTTSALRNFFRLEFLVNKDPKLLKPYPLVIDDVAMLALPAQGNLSSKAAIQAYKAPGVKWRLDSGAGTLSVYTTSLAVVDKNLRILQKQGFVITNLKELMKERRRFRLDHPLSTGIQKKLLNQPQQF